MRETHVSHRICLKNRRRLRLIRVLNTVYLQSQENLELDLAIAWNFSPMSAAKCEGLTDSVYEDWTRRPCTNGGIWTVGPREKRPGTY